MVAGPGSVLAWLHFVAWPQNLAAQDPPGPYAVAVSGTLLDDAFEHHAWATMRLIDACLVLTQEQLDAPVPATYGSILSTLRHMVGADTYYLGHLLGRPQVDTEHMGLAQLRALMEADRQDWRELLARGPQPGASVRDVDEGGWARDASMGLRFAQAIHHGTDHRSQVCSALTMLGVEPPEIDVWAFGAHAGRIVETELPR